MYYLTKYNVILSSPMIETVCSNRDDVEDMKAHKRLQCMINNANSFGCYCCSCQDM